MAIQWVGICHKDYFSLQQRSRLGIHETALSPFSILYLRILTDKLARLGFIRLEPQVIFSCCNYIVGILLIYAWSSTLCTAELVGRSFEVAQLRGLRACWICCDLMTSCIIFTIFPKIETAMLSNYLLPVLKYSLEWSIKQVQPLESDCKMCERRKAEKLHKRLSADSAASRYEK